MPTLPLEVHEVLEEEYASMYGSIDRPETGALYRAEDVIDEGWAKAIFQDCNIDPANGVLAALNDLVVNGPMQKLCNSRALTDSGKAMIAGYDDYTRDVSP